MRVLVYEFITGGGLIGANLPTALAHEARMMVAALVRDLGEIRGVTVSVCQDPRVELPALNALWLVPRAGEDGEALFHRALALCDAVWPIAPESGGVLERLSREILGAGKLLLGSTPAAVRLAASKRATAEALRAAGVASVPTYANATDMAHSDGAWVVKPDDGAGCVGARILPGSAAASAFLSDARDGSWVAQPWLTGQALSLSVLCKDGRAALLSVNQQRVAVDLGEVKVTALTINARRDTTGDYQRIAAAIVAALPGLWGYVGVDLIDTASGPVVLEVNPRLTTSFCAMREAFGENIGRRVVDLLRRGDLASVDLPAGQAVELTLCPATP